MIRVALAIALIITSPLYAHQHSEKVGVQISLLVQELGKYKNNNAENFDITSVEGITRGPIRFLNKDKRLNLKNVYELFVRFEWLRHSQKMKLENFAQQKPMERFLYQKAIRKQKENFSHFCYLQDAILEKISLANPEAKSLFELFRSLFFEYSLSDNVYANFRQLLCDHDKEQVKSILKKVQIFILYRLDGLNKMKYPSESVRQKERDAKITFLSTVHKDVLQLQSISEKYDKFLINKNHPLHTGPYWGSQGISIKPLSKPIAKSTPTLDALD